MINVQLLPFRLLVWHFNFLLACFTATQFFRLLWYNVVCLFMMMYIVAKWYILWQVSEQVNRKCPIRTQFYNFQYCTLTLSFPSNSPPPKFQNFAHVLYIAFLNMWPFISWSYCYTVWSAIVISDDICLSVCLSSVCHLSVCNVVHCGFHGRCMGLKVVPSCS